MEALAFRAEGVRRRQQRGLHLAVVQGGRARGGGAQRDHRDVGRLQAEQLERGAQPKVAWIAWLVRANVLALEVGRRLNRLLDEQRPGGLWIERRKEYHVGPAV